MKVESIAALAVAAGLGLYAINRFTGKTDEIMTGITDRTAIRQDEYTDRTAIRQDARTERTTIRNDTIRGIFTGTTHKTQEYTIKRTFTGDKTSLQ